MRLRLAVCLFREKQWTAARIDQDARTGKQLSPLKSGVYNVTHGNAKTPTLAFSGGTLTEILPSMDELERKGLVKCADEAKSANYPMIVPDDPSKAQLIYDNFGYITDYFTLNNVCPCPNL